MKRNLASFVATACLFAVASVAQVEAPKTDNVFGDTDMREAVTLAVTHVKGFLLLSKRSGQAARSRSPWI